MDYVLWLDQKPECKACRHIWSIRGELPPCETCRVVLFDNNIDAAEVYLAVRNQYITMPIQKGNTVVHKVIDLDIKAVKAAMDIYNVVDQKTCFEQVRHLFFSMLKEKGS